LNAAAAEIVDRIARRAAPYTEPEALVAEFASCAALGGREIGRSRDGRPIHGYRFGNGAARISLVAGAHADEPIGPATLAALLRLVASASAGAADDDARAVAALLEHATWTICPHVNPDGAHRNAAWIAGEADLWTWARGFVREAPGDDVEFGYPLDADTPARPENRAVADFLTAHGPFDFHASLHGMAFAEGAWFLICRERVVDTADLREHLAATAQREGLPLHDLDRGGEKGFFRIAPGFSTTPTSIAMREHFEALGDHEEAAKFLPSSMELAASFGGRPLAMVSEIPLFLVRRPDDANREPGAAFTDVRDRLPAAVAARIGGDCGAYDALVAQYGLEPVDLRVGVRLQLAMVLRGGCPSLYR